MNRIVAFFALFLSLLWGVAVAFEPAAPPPPKGLFVGVGYGGRRVSSTDGIHWENDNEAEPNGGDDDHALFNIAYGNGTFVAVGGGAAIGHIMLTADGKTWRELPQLRSRVATICFGNGMFLAGHSENFLVSKDGETWTPGAKYPVEGGYHIRKSAFGNGVFVAFGDFDPPGKPRTGFRAATADGLTLTSFAVDTTPVRGIAFGAGRFVVVGPEGLRESTIDGKTWEHAVREGKETLDSVVWDGARFLACGGGVAFESADGMAWKKLPKSPPGSAHFAAAGLYINAAWGGNIYHSTNGVEWTKAETASKNALEAVAFKPEK